ncbi:DNA replication licensing factor [Perkinsela sp. CCAP 1560/4]|nr:DNA replication licensing factor [Perkinsela sp. CCAP 1560/4]|eukprot:KNH09590.1 DNA replication licensing factor [Perkinsela sp. CCAP 1560/4]
MNSAPITPNNPPRDRNSRLLIDESLRCWLLTFEQSSIVEKGTNDLVSALECYLISDKGETVRAFVPFAPYFYILTISGMESKVEANLWEHFRSKLLEVREQGKEDLGLMNHLSGIQRKVLKVSFHTQNDLLYVRSKLAREIKLNQRALSRRDNTLFYTDKELDLALGEALQELPDGKTPREKRTLANSEGGRDSVWQSLVELREHDIPFDLRVCIDMQIYAGKWYDVNVYNEKTTLTVVQQDSKGTISLPLIPPALRYISFDIETTKSPLKFPQPSVDEIFMISIMYETQRGELLINREVVSEDIHDFVYFPRMQKNKEPSLVENIEQGGSIAVKVQNLNNEAEVIMAFMDILQTYQPHVVVTYNGDNFDFPFLATRAKLNQICLHESESKSTQSHETPPRHENDEGKFGPKMNSNKFGFGFLGNATVHVDCYYWVKRDSYLPMGSQSLKAVTKIKLNYNPVEIDPEEMLPLAKRFPQRMASYSISDVVATGELFLKYIQPFTFSLCTIIPYAPQKVLRRGSGALCEALLMTQASIRDILYPNKIEDENLGGEVVLENNDAAQSNALTKYKLKFHNGNLIDTETYIGGIVEALESGVFRCDLKLDFRSNAIAYDKLIENLDEVLTDIAAKELTEESILRRKSEGYDSYMDFVKRTVKDYESVKGEIKGMLEALRNTTSISEYPNILHLDVSAMYPNIILTNRLQPTSIVNETICSSCVFNDPANKCKRPMDWIWRGTMLTAGKEEVLRAIKQIEKESFPLSKVQQYMDRPRIPDEEPDEEPQKPQEAQPNRSYRGYRSGFDKTYLSGGTQASQAEKYKRFRSSQSSQGEPAPSSDETLFTKLPGEAQRALLKKRITEYCKKAHRKLHITQEVRKTSTVCMRENSFYVDTVRLFRDRRYEYKAQTREWKKKLSKIEGSLASSEREGNLQECRQKVIQYESLQTAHKCILNSFYGYVMRAGARWGSIEMAGIVTNLGGQIIHQAQEFAESIGIPLELDTDGIWCCLPQSFPLNFKLEVEENGIKKEVSFNYPCAVLNTLVKKKFSNDQYQEAAKWNAGDFHSESFENGNTPSKQHDVANIPENSDYITRPSQCCIEFEVDGPHHAMILPASQDEGGSIKKRYAVYYKDSVSDGYKLGELKGFELKRRGELKILKEFQENVFDRFMLGVTLKESYMNASLVARKTLEILLNHGYEPETLSDVPSNSAGTLLEVDDEDILEMVTESRTLSKNIGEYPPDQKSLALTTAKRLLKIIEMKKKSAADSNESESESADDYSKNTKSMSCAFVVSKYPIDAALAERALPIILFSDQISDVTRNYWLTNWTGVSLVSLSSFEQLDDSNVRESRFKYLKMILDWDYYVTRFSTCVQKIITIPAALQGLQNPIPKIVHPPWVESRLKRQQVSKFAGGKGQTLLGITSYPRNASDVAVGLTMQKKTLPHVPKALLTNLIEKLSVEGAMREASQDPIFTVCAAQAAQRWRRHLERTKNSTSIKIAGLDMQAGVSMSSQTQANDIGFQASGGVLHGPIHVLQVTTFQTSVGLHAFDSSGAPMNIILEHTPRVVINVTKPIHLDAYAALTDSSGYTPATLELLETSEVSLPNDQPVHHIYAVSFPPVSNQSSDSTYSFLLQCLRNNSLPMNRTNITSSTINMVNISQLCDGGFICGIFPPQADQMLETIVNLGNVIALKPDVSSEKLQSLKSKIQRDAKDKGSKNQSKKPMALDAFTSRRVEIRLQAADLVSFGSIIHQNHKKAQQFCVGRDGYPTVVQSLRPLYLYHLTKHVSCQATNEQMMACYILLIDVESERMDIFWAKEAERSFGDYLQGESQSSTRKTDELNKRRKTKPKASDSSIHKTTSMDALSYDDIKAFDATLGERLTEVQVSPIRCKHWNIPQKYNLVTYTSARFTDAVLNLYRDVDTYIAQFSLKYSAKAVLVIESSDSSKPWLHPLTLTHTDLEAESDWERLLLPSAFMNMPSISVPFNTCDVQVTNEDCGDNRDELPELTAVVTRGLHRYLFATLSVAYQLELSHYSGIPVCNLYAGVSSPDALFWDVTLARTLSSYGQIWWIYNNSVLESAACPSMNSVGSVPCFDFDVKNSSKLLFVRKAAWVNQFGAGLDDTRAAKKENTVISSDFSMSWCVEFTIENLDMAAIRALADEKKDLKKSQVFQGDENGSRTHRKIRFVRFMLDKIYKTCNNETFKNLAKSLLQNLSRWVESSSGFRSFFYDPEILRIYSQSIRKALALLLLYFQKCIGGKIIFADKSRMIVKTDKRTIEECLAYVAYALGKCQSDKSDPTMSELFKYLTLRPTSVWCPLLFINEKNFIGRRMDFDMHSPTVVRGSSIDYQWECSEVFPHAQQRRMLVAHLFQFMILSINLLDASEKTKSTNLGQLQPAQFPSLVISGMHRYLETSFQPQILKELDLFTHIGGDVCNYAGIFLRYVCMILQVTKSVEDKHANSMNLTTCIPNIMENVYQNASRILEGKVLVFATPQFSQQSQAFSKVQFLLHQMRKGSKNVGRIGYILPYTILRDFTCPYCSNLQNVYLLNAREVQETGEQTTADVPGHDGAELFDTSSTQVEIPSILQCLYCTYVFDPREIESTLIESLNLEITEYFSQDIVCEECGVCKDTILSRQCNACRNGEIRCMENDENGTAKAPKFSRYSADGKYENQALRFESMQEMLLGRQIVAKFRKYSLLTEITESLSGQFLTVNE